MTFNYFSTSKYKLHVYEVMTGLKFVLITSLERGEEMKEVLKDVYQLYITYQAKNVCYDLGTDIKSPLFLREVRNYLKTK